MNRPSFFAWRPATTRVLIVGFIILLIGLVTAFMATHFKPTQEVRLASGVFHLWVADTEQERIQGLSGVEKLGPNGGLLMDFAAEDIWGIWMKDMKIPLDIIWLDKDKKVIYIVKDASPELSTSVVFEPEEPARYVLELSAGTVSRAGIKTGQTAEFSLEGSTP
jgi:uncharacterized membrane protein (UPF0127 family)